jgi:hypothetical protein
MDGRQLILQMINEQNTLHRPLTLDNVSLSLPVGKVAGTERNTGVQVAGIHGMGYKGQIEVLYNRHNLPELFDEAGITPNLRTNGAITPAWIIAQLNAKYNFYLEATDLNAINVPIFEGLETTKNIEIVVKEASWNWTGTITLEMTYGNPLLETVVLVQLLPVLEHPADMRLLGARKSGLMCAYYFDFTPYLEQLKLDPKYPRFLNFDQAMEVGLKAGMPAWGNSTVYDFPTSAIPESNQEFERVMIQYYANGGVMGPIYFHYDLNW